MKSIDVALKEMTSRLHVLTMEFSGLRTRMTTVQIEMQGYTEAIEALKRVQSFAPEAMIVAQDELVKEQKPDVPAPAPKPASVAPKTEKPPQRDKPKVSMVPLPSKQQQQKASIVVSEWRDSTSADGDRVHFRKGKHAFNATYYSKQGLWRVCKGALSANKDFVVNVVIVKDGTQERYSSDITGSQLFQILRDCLFAIGDILIARGEALHEAELSEVTPGR